jgi:hypothetical protein
MERVLSSSELQRIDSLLRIHEDESIRESKYLKRKNNETINIQYTTT